MNSGVGPEGYFEQYYLSRDWRFYKSILSRIVAASEPGPILDLGAGCGYIVEACHRWGLSCVGLEGSENAVEIAHRRCPEIDIRQFLLSDPFPFEDNFFATVILNQVIEHLESSVADSCIREIYRVLRLGGALIIFSPSRFNKYEKRDDPTHINMYSPKELRDLLNSKGFTDIIQDDSPLPILGHNRLGRLIVLKLFRITHWERLSATANCVAYKPRPEPPEIISIVL
jgi:SAM-dependent methyltransferase